MSDETTQSFNIGNLFLLDAGVKPQQLSEALERQKTQPQRKVGEILIEMGALSPAQLQTLLVKQESWRKKGPSKTDVRRMLDLATEGTKAITADMDALIGEIPDQFK